MVKYIVLGISAILMLGGCVGQPRPKPEPVVKKVEQPKPKPKRKSAPVRHYKKGEVPPLPKREVDVDMDSMVDQASAEVLNEDNPLQEMH